ncbi:response regulator [Trinickia terrae]|uniref:Response regulator n=1 Tax=Trinickia terrae TaxID=2571161 RepID=A0A4V5PJF0_9BURK|nr:response regulator [Trinickia terrae]TKC91110.1 response regulator [Trinickia terrae]
MTFFVRQPVFYPVSVVFLDDNPDFLNALRGLFPDGRTNRFFTKPQAALSFMSARHHEQLRRMPSLGFSDFEQNGTTAIGQDVLIDDSRFEEVAAIVVDYEMPEMNGIEFLSSINNVACTKILLTGIAGDSEAVDAFNSGLIDFYLKKSDPRMAEKLAAYLADAQTKHCVARGHISLHSVGATYCDPTTVAVLNEIVTRERIAEYYWRPEQNAILMFDFAGNPSIFLAWGNADWLFQCDIVTDEGGPATLRQEMEARRIMPLFWPLQAYRHGMTNMRSASPIPIPGRSDAFYSWTRLDSSGPKPEPLTFARWRENRDVDR